MKERKITDLSANTELRREFRKTRLMSGATALVFLVCAGLVSVIKDTYVPVDGFTRAGWLQGVKNFLYLMAMFNILVIRYVVMRIYIAPGTRELPAIARRLATAGIASVLLSCLPCVYGLILFLLTGDAMDFYLLFGLSLIYFMMYFPRYKNWVSATEDNLKKTEEPCAVS
jgi:hypothetical protein